MGSNIIWFNKVVRHFIASLINPSKVTFNQVRELYEAKKGRHEFKRKRSQYPKPSVFTSIMTDAYVAVARVLGETKKKCFSVFKATKQRLCSLYGSFKRFFHLRDKGKQVVQPDDVQEIEFQWPDLNSEDHSEVKTWAQVVGTLWDAGDLSEPELDTHPTAGPSEP